MWKNDKNKQTQIQTQTNNDCIVLKFDIIRERKKICILHFICLFVWSLAYNEFIHTIHCYFFVIYTICYSFNNVDYFILDLINFKCPTVTSSTMFGAMTQTEQEMQKDEIKDHCHYYYDCYFVYNSSCYR